MLFPEGLWVPEARGSCVLASQLSQNRQSKAAQSGAAAKGTSCQSGAAPQPCSAKDADMPLLLYRNGKARYRDSLQVVYAVSR